MTWNMSHFLSSSNKLVVSYFNHRILVLMEKPSMNTKIGMDGCPYWKKSQTIETLKIEISLKCCSNSKCFQTCLKHKRSVGSGFQVVWKRFESGENVHFCAKTLNFLFFKVKINYVPIVLRYQKLCWLERATFPFHLSPIFKEFHWKLAKIQLSEVTTTFQGYPESVGFNRLRWKSNHPSIPILVFMRRRSMSFPPIPYTWDTYWNRTHCTQAFWERQVGCERIWASIWS